MSLWLSCSFMDQTVLDGMVLLTPWLLLSVSSERVSLSKQKVPDLLDPGLWSCHVFSLFGFGEPLTSLNSVQTACCLAEVPTPSWDLLKKRGLWSEGAETGDAADCVQMMYGWKMYNCTYITAVVLTDSCLFRGTKLVQFVKFDLSSTQWCIRLPIQIPLSALYLR